MMLQEAVDGYIATLSARECERGSEDTSGNNKNTIMAYRNDLTQFCSYLAQQRIQEWEQVIPEHIEGYVREMREVLVYRPTTVARKMASLKSFFRYLYVHESITADPIERIASPKVPKSPPLLLSADEIARLFRSVDTDTPTGRRDLAMLHMLCSTGMRASELVSLNLASFDAERAQIACTGHSARSASGRLLHLPEIAVDATQHYLRTARSRLVKHSGEDALFLNHRGERLTRQGFWLIIKGYARQADITYMTPHMLRNSFALAMLQEGVELRSLQEMLGHAHISTTQAYRQLVSAHLATGHEENGSG